MLVRNSRALHGFFAFKQDLIHGLARFPRVAYRIIEAKRAGDPEAEPERDPPTDSENQPEEGQKADDPQRMVLTTPYLDHYGVAPEAEREITWFEPTKQ